MKRTIIVFLLAVFVIFSSAMIGKSEENIACKIIFCSCCLQDREFDYFDLNDKKLGTFSTSGGSIGCTNSAGFNLIQGTTYYVIETENEKCKQGPPPTYFTACPCGEKEQTIRLPCCVEK